MFLNLNLPAVRAKAEKKGIQALPHYYAEGRGFGRMCMFAFLLCFHH